MPEECHDIVCSIQGLNSRLTDKLINHWFYPVFIWEKTMSSNAPVVSTASRFLQGSSGVACPMPNGFTFRDVLRDWLSTKVIKPCLLYYYSIAGVSGETKWIYNFPRAFLWKWTRRPRTEFELCTLVPLILLRSCISTRHNKKKVIFFDFRQVFLFFQCLTDCNALKSTCGLTRAIRKRLPNQSLLQPVSYMPSVIHA